MQFSPVCPLLWVPVGVCSVLQECFVSMGMDLPLVLATMPAYMEQKQVLWEWDFTPAYANHQKVTTLVLLLAHIKSQRHI